MQLRRAVCAGVVGCIVLVAAGAARGGTFFEGGLQHRPRLAFDGRDAAHAARIAGRIRNQEQPWAGGYAALRNLAENGRVVDYRTSGWESQPDKYEKLYSRETANGQVAAAKAAVAWLYAQGVDPAWRPLPRLAGQATPEGWVRGEAQAAARVIERMYDSWPCYRGFGVIDRGIVAAGSLAAHCEAYDFLAALPAALRPGLAAAEERLGDLAADLDFYHFTVDLENNNHGVRVASGLGMAAVTINRHDVYRWWKPWTAWHRPSCWIAKAERELHPTGSGSDLRYQMATGAFAEGTSYYAYAADLYLPFFFAYDRFLSGGGVPFLRSDLVTGGTLHNVDLRLPDGRRPAVDNSRFFADWTPAFFLSQAPGGVRSAADQAVLLWDFERSGRPGIGGSHAAALLAAYDPPAASVAAAAAMTSPWPVPTRFLGARGVAVLRTGAGTDASYALVVAEQGEVRTHGLGHDSVDHGAYTFFAHGDLVTIDPGYAGWPEVSKTNRGEHRSMVLVDGKAPAPAHQALGFLWWVSGSEDARLVAGARTAAGPEVRSAEVSTAYEGAAIRRTIALVEERYLLVEDRCSSGSAKTYTTQIETNAGAAKGRPLQRQGATVRYQTNRRRVEVSAGAAASAPLSTSIASGFDSFGESPEGHDTIRYAASGTAVTFLTAIAANAPGSGAPAVEEAPAGHAAARALRIEAGGAVDIAVSNPSRALLTLPAVAGTRAITTDAELAIVSFAPLGAARVLMQVGGTTLAVAP